MVSPFPWRVAEGPLRLLLYQEYIRWVKEDLGLGSGSGDRFLQVYNQFGATTNLVVNEFQPSVLYLLAALYRETHSTFEEYCRERWDMSINYADRLMRTTKVIENIKSVPIGTVQPANESQVRPLTKLQTPELQQEAWQKLSKGESRFIVIFNYLEPKPKPFIIAYRKKNAVPYHFSVDIMSL
jgi:hypothetical protein